MRYGFVINQRSCIGCHACTVACKTENGVPLGSFRTWVKYVEKGEFPNTRRHFAVLRCNHCDDAPCVEICPTVALFKRDDGIVDFDNDRCIGCKACMQACPYDALYLDPNTHTAAKCHYCAHRIDVGLEPACVIVCPTRSIIAGDLDDPTSEISQLVSRATVHVRRPEQNTKPKLLYVGADAATISPGIARQLPSFMWAERKEAPLTPFSSNSGLVPHQKAVNVYDVHHPAPWGWAVGAYLWTKSIASGALSIGAAAVSLSLMGGGEALGLTGVAAGLISLIFIALTTGLLIFDLKRPERFWRLLVTPNLRSWLVWGGYIIMAFGVVALVWLFAGIAGATGVLRLLAIPAIIVASLTAGYSAFLFAQAEGRDFWQSPLLLPALLAHAGVGGAAALLLVAPLTGASGIAVDLLSTVLNISLTTALIVVLLELYLPHTNDQVAGAADLIRHGPFAKRFWGITVAAGTIAPVLLLLLTSSALAPLAAILALVGMYVYQDVWVRAGQAIPIS
ncbi:MAG: polysulfide reductase NrfD [Chloroflexi bacterium]|nr:polysulfide reductase NrfD [Chloroflexota bacterium]